MTNKFFLIEQITDEKIPKFFYFIMKTVRYLPFLSKDVPFEYMNYNQSFSVNEYGSNVLLVSTKHPIKITSVSRNAKKSDISRNVIVEWEKCDSGRSRIINGKIVYYDIVFVKGLKFNIVM